MNWNYDTIKRLAKELRKEGTACRVTDLIALAPQNDPFYCGSPAEMEGARWFASLWQQFNYGHGVHLRRIHYQLVSQDPLFEKPNGLPYENTLRDWQYLTNVSKWARYLELVPADHFVDRRNPDAIVNARWVNPGDWEYKDPTPGYEIADGDGWYRHELPSLPGLPSLPSSLPDLPDFTVKGYRYDGWDCNLQQGYHVELWAEKATMNDVLEPLCHQYKVNLVTGLGELSITAVRDFMKRVRKAQRPARILYISDFDPAGLGMPVSVARKAEYFQRSQDFDDLDIRLEPIVLTAEQVREYNLPRVPVKDTDLRKAGFEAAHGEGQVELDALEALYPGKLAEIIRAAILAYYDPSLNDRAQERRKALSRALDDERQDVLSELDADLEALRGDYAELVADFGETRERFAELVAQFQPEIDAYLERLEAIKERGRELYGWLYDRLEMVDVNAKGEYPLPEPDLPAEPNSLLYVSSRGYVDQLGCYTDHRQGNGR